VEQEGPGRRNHRRVGREDARGEQTARLRSDRGARRRSGRDVPRPGRPEQIDRTYLLRDKIGLDRQAFVEEVRRCLVDPPRIEDILPRGEKGAPKDKDGSGGGGAPGDPSTMAGGA